MPRRAPFDYSLNYAELNLRKHPELYRVGKGEQGVLLVEPYKSEILPHWRFADLSKAKKSAKDLLRIFKRYKRERDFIGMDMTRKFIQMGITRSRRYANHRSGRKYDKKTGEVLPLVEDPTKAQAALIFRKVYDRVVKDPLYLKSKLKHQAQYG